MENSSRTSLEGGSCCLLIDNTKQKKDRRKKMAKQMKKDADMNIPYQNKDSISKLFGERMKGKSLSLFGLKSDEKVVGICPTNIPVLDVKELRMDNLLNWKTVVLLSLITRVHTEKKILSNTGFTS